MRHGFRIKAVALLVLVAAYGCSTAQPVRVTLAPEPVAADCSPLYVVGDSPSATAPFKLEAAELCQRFGVTPVLRHPPYLEADLADFVAQTDEVDLVIIAPRYLSLYVGRGLILPVDRWIDKESTWYIDILPVYRNLYMRFGKQTYGFVYDGDTHLLFYRQDLLSQLGLAVPETWSEHDQVARRFLHSEALPGGTRYGTAMVAREGKAYIWFAERYASQGGLYFDDEMRPLIADGLAVEVLTELVELYREVAPEAAYDWEDLNHALLGGTLPMAVQWSDTARFSFDTKVWQSKVGGLLAWSEVPGGLATAPRGGIWFGRVLTIPAHSQQADLAAQVALYMTSAEVSGRMVTRADTINDPFRYSHLAHPELQTLFPEEGLAVDLYQAVSRSLERPMADLTIPGGWDYTLALDQAVLRVLRGEAVPAVALQEAAADWEVITEQLGREAQREAYQEWLILLAQGNRP